MKAWSTATRVAALVAFAMALAGCVRLDLTPAQHRALFAPLLSLRELTAAATAYQLVHGRWPSTVEQLRTGLALADLAPDLIAEVAAVELVEATHATVTYDFRFAGGGSSRLQMTLNGK